MAACLVPRRNRYQVAKVVGTFVQEINNRVRIATMVGAID